MYQGARVWNETWVNLWGLKFSNRGGYVATYVRSSWNRDLNHRDACYYYTNSRGWIVPYVRNSYSHSGWSSFRRPDLTDFYGSC